MTPKDRALIEKAKTYSYIDWRKISDLEKRADSEEARLILCSIRNRLYHDEEYYAGML